jgi:hypothetical protein
MTEVAARTPEAGADVEHTALKEWAVLVDAMARGDIIAMVRKGGIREQRAGFTVRHDRFLFYPTYFHEKAAEMAPHLAGTLSASHERRPPEGTIRVEYVADVAAVWAVTALAPLERIGPEHGLDWRAVESRFHYKARPGVQVIAARVKRLRETAELPEVRRYAGCVSWVELDAGIDVSDAVPVLDDAAFARRVAQLRAALGDPD